ncbi:hypothetical protein SLEP1_g46316 [Rubroshorea leprosula]|uniref:Uncharacterized protein n=1 Tax=Rubroshorea leprosula TaxID=152421 RepID=A0AAV5LLU2_9ROSI|nr:hypothetical protein SLEP1_g46316 [Rubroshorea leprosula]
MVFSSTGNLILETTTLRNLVQNLSEVRELEFRGVNMASVNPRFFMNLSSSLTTLNLRYCQLRGNFPNSIFRFPNLKIFYLSGPLGKRNLTIDLPSSNWSSPLQQLYLEDMDCGRRLPESIGDLKSLQSLSLFHCNLEGSIPTSIGNLSELTSLELSSNQFSGPILASIELDMFSVLQNLETIFLSDNNLSLRMNVNANFTLPKLIDVSFSSCNLSEFPNFIRHSNGLQSLVLSKNSIHGNILKWICENDLMILDLSHNNLSGKIPNCLPKFLSVLNLQGNNFDGNIPFGFPEGCGLINLNLHGNQMNGLLPRSLVNCRILQVLDVGNNNISDTFPQWLESLLQLQVLVLRANKFHGFVHSTKEVSSCFNPSILVEFTVHLRSLSVESNHLGGDQGEDLGLDLESLKILLKRGVFIGAMLYCLLVFACKRVLAVERVVNVGYGVIERWALLLRNAWSKVSMVLKIFKEQGVILTALLGLSAFFSMAETSITTPWPCKVCFLCLKIDQ